MDRRPSHRYKPRGYYENHLSPFGNKVLIILKKQWGKGKPHLLVHQFMLLRAKHSATGGRERSQVPLSSKGWFGKVFLLGSFPFSVSNNRDFGIVPFKYGNRHASF